MKAAVLPILRDGLLVSPRLAAAALRVALDRGLGRPAKHLREICSTGWLSRHLGIDARQIESASIEALHSGTATRSRLRIRYVDSSRPAGPESLFIKSSPADFGSALFGLLLDLGGNEVEFYRHIRAEVPVRTPQVHWCGGNSRSYLMLLEDLTDRGCSFRDLASKCSLDEAVCILHTLARLHAQFWESERFESDLAWVKRFETNRDFRLLDLVRQLSVPVSFQRFGHVFPDRVREMIPHLMDAYEGLEEHWARGPRTLIHGDAHLGNMYFQDGEAGLLDWQVHQLGQGMRDVAYFLINSVSEELRLAHQVELIEHYLATLDQQGVSLDFETAWYQYRLQSVYAWIAGVVTAPSNFQPPKVVAAGLSRSTRALVDLDAVGLIREL